MFKGHGATSYMPACMDENHYIFCVILMTSSVFFIDEDPFTKVTGLLRKFLRSSIIRSSSSCLVTVSIVISLGFVPVTNEPLLMTGHLGVDRFSTPTDDEIFLHLKR